MQVIYEYDVFLSFASEDEKFVKPIWQEMSQSGLRVFWSDETLKQNIGQSFFTVIQNALNHSMHFVLICTPNSMKSNWVKVEYEAFFSQHFLPSEGARRLILFHDEGFDRNTLPSLLRNIQISESIHEIISSIGGVNIQRLKSENRDLKELNKVSGEKIYKLESKLHTSEETHDALRHELDNTNRKYHEEQDDKQKFLDIHFILEKKYQKLKRKSSQSDRLVSMVGSNIY